MALLNARRILVRVYHQLQLLQSPVPCNHGNYSHLAVTSGWLQASVDRHLPERRLFHSGVVLCSMKKSIKGFIPDSNAINKLQDVHVTGLDGEDLGTMTKRKARELAENLEVKLVLTEKEPSGRIKYKLMTGKQVTEERLRLQQLKKAEKKKAVKNTRITSKISKHDLQMKTKQLLQWVDKGHEVKITVKSATPNSSQVGLRFHEKNYIMQNVSNFPQNIILPLINRH